MQIVKLGELGETHLVKVTNRNRTENDDLKSVFEIMFKNFEHLIEMYQFREIDKKTEKARISSGVRCVTIEIPPPPPPLPYALKHTAPSPVPPTRFF